MHPATAELPTYLHRTDSATGTTQSICTRCFATVARARQVQVLALAEAQHDCPAPKTRAHAA